jgi:Protein of unknown function (DUF3285)
MSEPSVSTSASDPTPVSAAETPHSEAASSSTAKQPQPSYVKLAMRNMVRKRTQSLTHFALTAIGLMGFFVGVSYLTR